jgi:hypothetical protein
VPNADLATDSGVARHFDYSISIDRQLGSEIRTRKWFRDKTRTVPSRTPFSKAFYLAHSALCARPEELENRRPGGFARRTSVVVMAIRVAPLLDHL